MKSKEIIFALQLVWIGITSIACNTTKTQEVKKPNIIFIMADDHAYQAISAYGSELIETTNIDRIARDGVVFNNAFVTNSICGPSRAVILTGKYSHVNGFMDNADRFDGNQQTMPKILQKNGYRTAIVGKWHLKSDPQGFDYWNVVPGQGSYYNPKFINMGKDTIYNGYVTDITTDLALEWLDDNKDESFCLMIHQKAPHRNQMPPLSMLELYNDRKFEMPESFYDNYKDQPALQRNGIRMADDLAVDFDTKVFCDTCRMSLGRRKENAYHRDMGRLTPEQRQIWDKAYQKEYESFARVKTDSALITWQYQRFMEDYLRCIKSVDDNVGRVLDYLRDNGLSENTIVVYTSDQGFYLGEHGLYDKRFMYEESFRTPMIFRYPGHISHGETVDRMVMNLDIAPTLLDFAGAPIPGDMQGRSMKDILIGDQVNDWRNQIYYHYYEISYGLTAHYGIRTERYKLIHFYDPIDAWELYDLKKDPDERDNLYMDPEYTGLIDSLKIRLSDLQRKYNDTTGDISPGD